MFFYLDYRFSADAPGVGIQVHDHSIPAFMGINLLHLQPGFQRVHTIDTPGGRLVLLGDPVYRLSELLPNKFCSAARTINENALYEQVRGHYYWFLVHAEGICCGTSFGAVFPLYYYRSANRWVLCSSAAYLAGQVQAEARSHRNLLERLLFNYPFFNSTWWSDVYLLEAHRYIRLGTLGGSIAGHFELNRHFGTGDNKSRKHLVQLTELFADECQLFIPEEPFGISFTGGFDGRTLVAAALQAGRQDFITYSFGRPGASDVTFPARQAHQNGLLYLPINLDQDYVQHHSLDSALAFMRLTEYNGNFGRPHYEFAADQLSKRVKFILTGNFGSELFRALHQPGVMMSEALIGIFAAQNDRWKDELVRHTSQWDLNFFRMELDALIADLEAYLAPMAHWPANHRFYRFVFSEIFRKYFGPELVMQSHYLNNRTPFLSLRFFSALNDTMWSGVHSNLFEKQKNKRLKGQTFYSAFLRRADRRLYRQLTSKGYSPADVLELWRRPLLLGRVALQKFVRRGEADSNAVEAFFERYHRQLANDINPTADEVLVRSGLAAWLVQSPLPNEIEQMIKYYSIAAGWHAAEAKSTVFS